MRSRTLLVATGYAELGMWSEAWDELEAIDDAARVSFDVLALRLEVLVQLKRWEPAAILADSLIAKGVTAAEIFLNGAYAVRRCRSLTEAKEFLLKGPHLAGKDPHFHFNLACYECQLGNIPAAKEQLEHAFKLDASLREDALDDPDLEPLWGADTQLREG